MVHLQMKQKIQLIILHLDLNQKFYKQNLQKIHKKIL